MSIWDVPLSDRPLPVLGMILWYQISRDQPVSAQIHTLLLGITGWIVTISTIAPRRLS